MKSYHYIGERKRVYSLNRGFNVPDMIFSSFDNMRHFILSEIRRNLDLTEQNFSAKTRYLDSESEPIIIYYKALITEEKDFYRVYITEKCTADTLTHIEIIPKNLFKGIKVKPLSEESDGNYCGYCGESATGYFYTSIPGGLYHADVCEKCTKIIEEGRFEDLPNKIVGEIK